MGNSKSGVIWNDSDFDVKYYLSSQVVQTVSTNRTHEIDPEIELNIKGNLRIGGWKRLTETHQNYTQIVQTYEVLAGRINTTGLDQLEMNKYFLTVKAVIGKYEKLLIGNCPIRSSKDIRYKIRKDLSYRQMEQKEAEKFTYEATLDTKSNGGSYMHTNPERENRRELYLENLQKKTDEIIEENSPELKSNQIEGSTKIIAQ